VPLPSILPNQDIAPLEQDPEENRGPFDLPTSGKRFILAWYLFFQSVLEFINKPQPVVPGTNAIVLEVTGSSAGQAVDVAPTTLGAILIVKWTQDGTGGNYPAWSVNFAAITSINVKLDANAVTMFQFALLSDNLWWPTSYPVLQE